MIFSDKRSHKKKKKVLKYIIIGFLLMTVILLLAFVALQAAGKRNLFSKSQLEPTLLSKEKETETLDDQGKQNWKPGWVEYEGEIYEYNESILTFLFMGIDKDAEVKRSSGIADGGQADALFLLVINTGDQTWRILSINRNTMAEIELYDENGTAVQSMTAQIAVQHGFGDGLEQSCDYQVRAVQRLLYNIPIHGYCAVNMDAVIDVTDLVGGVTVTAMEDIFSAIQDETLGQPVVKKDETILLNGREAYSYVRYRDIDAQGSANLRLMRQQQYLSALIAAGKTKLKKDLSLPLKAYQTISKKMVTDVTTDEIVYLAGILSGYTPDDPSFYSLQGETVQGKQFEEFYPDEEALYRLMIQLFYQQVELSTNR